LNIGTAVQRIRAEIALSEGEEQYRSLVEQLNDMVFTTDEQGTFTFVSPAVELIAGFAPSEVVGKNFSDFIIETDLPRAANDFKAVLAGEAVVAEYRISNKSGEIRWTRSTSRPLFKGNILTGMQGIVTDITDQKLAEVALRESEEKYRTLVEQIPDVIFTFDAQGLVTFVSSAIISLTGYAPSDLLGQSLYSQLLFEDDLPKAQESYSDFSKGKSNTGEYRIITASEDLRWVRLEATPVFKDGIFTGGQGIATDITSSRQAEEALRESEREYRRLVDLAQEGILAIDPNGKISFVNPRMAEMLGYATDEMLGKQLIDFMAPEMVTIAEQQLDRGARGEAEQLEFKFLRKDGGKVDALLETAPRFDEYGEYIGALSCVINITERKRLEEELQEKEQKYREHLEELVEQRTVELKNTVEQLAVEVSERKTIEIELRKAKKISEAANKAKSDFLANMSHELRTPLNSIIGFSQILQDGIPGVVNDEQQEVLGNILDSAKLLLALINDILDLSKIEAGRITLNFQEFSLQHFLKRCLELFTERANTQNIQLSLDIADDLTIIIADEIRLKQIIFNLLSNALKFTPTGGEVGIIALNTDTRIEFTVWDTGIGIAQENLPKLFQAFQQLETPYSREHQGTGLGLYYSKKLVELHGGEIWVETLEGTGSRFTFTIPTNLQITDSPPK
ncbi:MAG TPA: PAS domain S-box protein, partial [Candidatus Lokiarchaeia archaeon]|nr:PAS domain S-box protein [Candidatus Lokiarchaeia archaeon]